MNRAHQGTQNNPLEDLKRQLSRRPISEFTEKEIFHPEGYAKKVMDVVDVSAVKLRKVFQEFKAIVDDLEKDKNLDKAMARLYKLYAILEYQEKRNVLKENFKNLMFELFNNIEKYKSIQAFKKAYDLLMAMVAYSKKS